MPPCGAFFVWYLPPSPTGQASPLPTYADVDCAAICRYSCAAITVVSISRDCFRGVNIDSYERLACSQVKAIQLPAMWQYTLLRQNLAFTRAARVS